MKNQRGEISLSSLLFIIMIIGYLMMGFKVAPMYWDNLAVQKSMKTVASSKDSQRSSLDQLKTRLRDQLNVNGLRDSIPFDALKIVQKGNTRYLSLHYTVSQPVFAELSVAANFDLEAEILANDA